MNEHYLEVLVSDSEATELYTHSIALVIVW